MSFQQVFIRLFKNDNWLTPDGIWTGTPNLLIFVSSLSGEDFFFHEFYFFLMGMFFFTLK